MTTTTAATSSKAPKTVTRLASRQLKPRRAITVGCRGVFLWRSPCFGTHTDVLLGFRTRSLLANGEDEVATDDICGLPSRRPCRRAAHARPSRVVAMLRRISRGALCIPGRRASASARKIRLLLCCLLSRRLLVFPLCNLCRDGCYIAASRIARISSLCIGVDAQTFPRVQRGAAPF